MGRYSNLWCFIHVRVSNDKQEFVTEDIKAIVQAGALAPFAGLANTGKDGRKFIVVSRNNPLINQLSSVVKNRAGVFAEQFKAQINSNPILQAQEERIKPSEYKFTLGFFDDSVLVGIVTFMRENNIKTAHKGNVFGMYLVPGVRGQGIG